MIFFGFTAYAIIKHHLFDVRLAIVRSVTYTLVLVTLAAIYLVIAFVISAVFNSGQTSTSQIVSGVAISLLLAFIFQPIKRFFDRITNRIFYKDNYDINDFFARLNKSLSTTTDLRGLLERVAYEIGHTLKGEQAFFYINTDNGHYITAGTPHHKQLPKIDALKIGEVHDGEREVIVASMLENDDPMRRLMISHRIELILPLVKEDKIIGYLCLGDHLTSGYTNRDIRALYTISDELVIAIQNALAVHEIRELNATLQQKVNNATKELRSSNLVLRQLDKVKDEFISMASHQLRTPLTSVKGYISMVIEGDAGKITNPQKKLLEEAFMSSERMVHLINDFLNVSRIQTGKFIIEKSPVDLSKLVSEELDSLRPNATARGLKFNYKPPKKFPIMELDEGKMRQVIMNYADNAIYYTSENSIIYINLSIDNNEALFTVKDTGIGVPVKEREHLFSKFYRASNARVRRPDGTGVGIYLAKKVINALGGKVVFESVEGKGSTFGFRLPIPSQKNEKTNK
jgi:signal transduction histidine kinase